MIDKLLKGFNLAGYSLTKCDRILRIGQILRPLWGGRHEFEPKAITEATQDMDQSSETHLSFEAPTVN